MKQEVNLANIQAAAGRIADEIVTTPLLSSERLNEAVGCRVVFKCENLQHIGAFKARGACNAVFSLNEEEAAAGVATHSSGNHAAALSRAARLRGIQAYVVMPRNSRPSKIAAVRRFGVEPVFCEPDAPARQAAADRIVAETGATFIHPYNDPRIICGQGTVGLEIHQQASAEVWGEIDAVVIPVGGGGLLAGCLTSLKALRPDLPVYAAEPAWADDAFRSLQAGSIQPPTRYDTVADGLRTPLGSWTFPIIRDHVEAVLLADEEQIIAATRQIVNDAKLIVEPSAAVSLAAVQANPRLFQGKTVVAVLSGGNVECGDDILGPEQS